MSKFIKEAKDILENYNKLMSKSTKLSAESFIFELNESFDLNGFLMICFQFLLDSKDYDLIPEKCITILNKKAYDYSSENNRYSNFEISNKWAENCLNSINKDALKIVLDDKVSFAVLMGTKVARLTELLTANKVANNESVDDSIIDLMNYRLLLEGFMLGLQ